MNTIVSRIFLNFYDLFQNKFKFWIIYLNDVKIRFKLKNPCFFVEMRIIAKLGKYRNYYDVSAYKKRTTEKTNVLAKQVLSALSDEWLRLRIVYIIGSSSSSFSSIIIYCFTFDAHKQTRNQTSRQLKFAKHEISICVRFTWLSNVHTNTVPAALVFNRLCNIAATLAIIIIIRQICSLISVSKIWIVVESYAFFFYCLWPIESKIRAMEPNPNRQYCKLKIELHLDRNIRKHFQFLWWLWA